MGKATGIIASVGVSLGSFIAGHFAMESPAAKGSAQSQIPAPWSITSLDDLQRVRNQGAHEAVNPATGRPDPSATLQAWVEQEEQAQNPSSARHDRH